MRQLLRPTLHAVPDHFYWIDALRGLAALTVVIFHYHHFYLADFLARPDLPAKTTYPWSGILLPAFQYGGKAVELFWIISGVVFSHVYLQRQATLREFVVARFARLYPLHFATLVIVLLLQVISLQWAGHWQIYGNNDLKHFVLQLFFASNWITLSEGLSFNGPIWSVSLEMFAYALFFVLLVPLRRFGGAFALALAGLLWWVAHTPELDLPVIRAGAFQCASYFFVGSFLYFFYRRFAGQAFVLLSAAAGAAVIGFISGSEVGSIVGISAFLILVLAVMEHRFPRQGRKFVGLGDISYSLYLVHVPLQMLFLVICDFFFGGSRAFADSHWTLPIYLLASITLAHIAYRQFERPVGRFLRHSLSNGVWTRPTIGKKSK